MSTKKNKGAAAVAAPSKIPNDLRPGDILVCNKGERVEFERYDTDGDVWTAMTSDRHSCWKPSGRHLNFPQSRWITNIIRQEVGSASFQGIPVGPVGEITSLTAEQSQVGGDHYRKLKIQPMRYSMANGLDACQHTIIKYVTRFRDKGGIADLEKAKHTIDLLIQFEKEKEANRA